MERKIGEIFEHNGEWYQCMESPDGNCTNCDMNFSRKCPISTKECTGTYRIDKKNVIFKKLEKVGEPYEHYEKFYQCYKLPMETEIRLLPNNCYPIGKDNLVEIEIKQKEDMEEKEPTYEELLHYYHSTVGLWAIDRNPQEVNFDWICKNAFQLGLDKTLPNFEKIGKNLKPFNLEASRSGKPVCTRDGRKARIICFDRISGDDYYKIVACVTAFDWDFEEVIVYGIDGYIVDSQNPRDEDLMMLPEKKEGWVNIYKSENGTYYTGAIFGEEIAALVNTSEIEITTGNIGDYIDTFKIRWEE